MTPEWARRRLAELHAAPPPKRKKAEPFVKVPLWWATASAQATKSPKTLICIRLLHLRWRNKSPTFQLPNRWLEGQGVSRFTKYRTLRELETAGLITVDRRSRKSPVVTVVML